MNYTYGRSRSSPFFVRVCRSGSVSLGFGASVVTLHAAEFQEFVRTVTRAARDIDLASSPRPAPEGVEDLRATERLAHRLPAARCVHVVD